MIESRDWSASETVEPDGRRRLRVAGTCVVPTSGWGGALRRHHAQEAADELLLDLVLDRPTGPVLQVISSVHVAYEETTDRGYARVSVLPDGPRGIPVAR